LRGWADGIDADLPVRSGRLGLLDLPSANWVARTRIDRWTGGWTDRRQMHRYISGQTDIIDVYIFIYNKDSWMDTQMDRWVDRWMEG
jgi:hypothetical protein